MCAEYYEQVLGCTPRRSPVRDLALSLRLCDRQHVRGAADGREQHPAGALGHRAERRRDGGALQADRAAQRARGLSPAARSRPGADARRSARFAISSRPASGCRRKSGTRGRRRAAIRSSTGSAARNGLHDHRQHAGAPPARLVRPCDAERGAAHRRRRRRALSARPDTHRAAGGAHAVGLRRLPRGRRRSSTRRRIGRPERFRPDGWFATGDEYLRDADGFYHHRGRTGDMLRVSGIWISPSEIEDALAGIASIAESAAVLGESEIGLAEIVLYVVPARRRATAAAAVGRGARAAVAGAAGLQAAAALRGGRRPAAHRHRQGPAPQAARALRRDQH